MVGVKVSKTDHLDGYSYDVPVGSDGNVFMTITSAAATSLATMVSETYDSSKGLAFGSVYWNGGKAAPVGCATVAPDPVSGSVYYGNEFFMPTTLRSNTNPLNGVYYIFNMDPQGYTINATVEA
jgi:hypothetical protein